MRPRWDRVPPFFRRDTYPKHLPRALLTQCTLIEPSQVDDVVEHVRKMAAKYDFEPIADAALETVRESAALLHISLSDQDVSEAVRRLLDTDDADPTGFGS